MTISGGVAGDADAIARSGAVGVVDGATPVSMNFCKDRNATSVGATSSAAVCAETVDVNDFVAKAAADDVCCGSFSMAMQPAISLVMSSSPLMLKLFERQLSANDSLRSSSLKLPSSREVEDAGSRMAELDASRAPHGDRDGADREAKRHGDDEQGGDEADDDGDGEVELAAAGSEVVALALFVLTWATLVIACTQLPRLLPMAAMPSRRRPSWRRGTTGRASPRGVAGSPTTDCVANE